MHKPGVHNPSVFSLLLITGLLAICAGRAPAHRDMNCIDFSRLPAQQPRPETKDRLHRALDGRWEGVLSAPGVKVRLILNVAKSDGEMTATLDSPDQGAAALPIDSIGVDQGAVRFEMKALGASYAGRLGTDGSEIDGVWTQQGAAFPLTFKRSVQAEKSQDLLSLRRADAGGHSLNLLIGGAGAPTVVFEAGFGGGIASWSTLQAEIAKFARTVSYDRAGLGRSEMGPKPRSARQIALELHAALEKAEIKPPYVLVGHSLGGVYVRIFTDMYPKEVAGMVLVDPSQEAFEEWARVHLAAEEKEEAAAIARAPEGVRAELAALDATYAEARAARAPSGIPVTLLSATRDESISAEARRVWIEKQRDWIARVPGGKHIIAETNHFIQAQQPALVIEAIRQIVDQARRGQRPSRKHRIIT